MTLPKGWRRQEVLLDGVDHDAVQGTLLVHGIPDSCVIKKCDAPVKSVVVMPGTNDRFRVAALCALHESEFLARPDTEDIVRGHVLLLDS